MTVATPVLRRYLAGVFAASAAGGVIVTTMALPGTPSATAASDPCAASEVAKTIGSVATSMGSYLDAHPETNTALTTISQQQGGPQSLVALKAYFDANPQAAKDMQTLQRPLQSLSARCRLPLTLPQAMGLLQGAQSPAGAVAGGLPNALPVVQNAGVPGAAPATPTAPAAVVTPAGGPLPGPATTAPR